MPLLIILAMVVVGLELTPADLSRVLHYPAQVAVALLCQVLILPLLAAALILLLRPAPAIAGGLILAAAAPQAMTSNYFCLLARADVALSVTLTAASSVLAVVSTPLIAGLAFDWLAEQQAGFVLPVGKVMQQVVTGLLFPVGVGMLVRRYAPGFTERNRVRFQRLSMAAVAAMLAIILTDQAATIERNLASIVVASVLFTAGAAALGLGVAKALSWNRGGHDHHAGRISLAQPGRRRAGCAQRAGPVRFPVLRRDFLPGAGVPSGSGHAAGPARPRTEV